MGAELRKRAAQILAIQVAHRMKETRPDDDGPCPADAHKQQPVHRILDERDAGITLMVLFRLADMLGMPLRLGSALPADLQNFSSGPPQVAFTVVLVTERFSGLNDSIIGDEFNGKREHATS